MIRRSTTYDLDVAVPALGVTDCLMATLEMRWLVVVAKQKVCIAQQPVTTGTGYVALDSVVESPDVNGSESLGRVCCSVEVVLTNDGGGISSTIAKNSQTRHVWILHCVHGTSGV